MTIESRVLRKRGRYIKDTARIIARSYLPGDDDRIKKIIERILDLPEEKTSGLFEQVLTNFSERHRNIGLIFERNFQKIQKLIPEGVAISDQKRALMGAYFTMEYSIESAALFNPSIVLHPDQTDLPKGCIRFIMSFRAVGEGHISSIEFRSGTIDVNNNISLDTISNFVETPEIQLNPTFDKHLFQLKLNEMNACNEITTYLFGRLPPEFTYEQGKHQITQLLKKRIFTDPMQTETLDIVSWVAKSNYEVKFSPDHKISARAIFPVSENESMGIEDARFVRFVDDNGDATYCATYTAYNGRTILPQLIQTKDFVTFKIRTLNGKAVQNKGMALFPRRINGKFVMASRQDGENNRIMFSDHMHFWQKSRIIQEPSKPWEFVQVGNCGSPVETEEGWILLTHGVGPMRQYTIGALLLDLDDPTKIIGRLPEPLITPNVEERDGYVPNVVYTCGSIIHNGSLIVPYGMSDTKSGFASIPVGELLDFMKKA
ncbi:MAG: glycoside hydrolase family 130 protein [Deltaproteobacteria bacterium]|nr:glycoside hydrolase family 130 protein [Deltaproteobacteria bacterium]